MWIQIRFGNTENLGNSKSSKSTDGFAWSLPLPGMCVEAILSGN